MLTVSPVDGYFTQKRRFAFYYLYLLFKILMAQSAGAAEYFDCISAEE